SQVGSAWSACSRYIHRRSIASRLNDMAGFVAQSSTTSGTSAAKPRASKNGARASKSKAAANDILLDRLFAELAAIAEMSAIERQLREFGFRCIAGTDEVGRGCLAGPVVAACVILDDECSLCGGTASKVSAGDDRVGLCRAILSRARAVTIGVMEPETIDRINIL